MKLNCPNSLCVKLLKSDKTLVSSSPESRRVVRDGYFYRRSDRRWVQRFLCRGCGQKFSRATLHPCRYQKRRNLNGPLERLLCSGVSQRRAAFLLGANRKTIVRKFRFLATQAELIHHRWVAALPRGQLTHLQFDDLETSEHSKCKPVSVPLVVDTRSRKILAISVATMPAKGHLAAIAKIKYGYRPDERSHAWNETLSTVAPLCAPNVEITSDENPHYPRHIKKHLPKSIHIRFEGKRGCVAGQGELKKTVFDPLFSLNHTCAMLRANLNRLFRRTWCTTKQKDQLRAHLYLYAKFHNTYLTSPHPHLKGAV